ncbi:methyl-accepting chemotaxis protein [Marinobacter xestospongiae]|uniref:Methyl-accepting chemotaxis protein n=1 Tax=Marinobacter xestospongiae TaxID=994319 RepID=A0ABU3W019_9GAMM|nr:methyl-accepting chemotaxis protein [Marinobacter xestospongiae]MDV2079700.1 methyl-accepting chemotaxis protein [Marinobacter xestospongiae]
MKIKTKLLSAFLATTLLPVLIVSLITINNVIEQAEADFLNTSTTDISIVDQSFENFFDVIGYNVSFMAEASAVTNTNAGPLTKYFGEGRKPSQVARQNGGREEAIFDLFSAIGDNNPMLGYVYMGEKDGGYLEWPGTADYGDWDPRTEPWFDIGKQANYQIARRDGYYWEPDDAVYVSVLKGYRNSQGDFGGVVAIDVSLKSLTDMVQQIRLGDSGYLIIVEGSGNILVDGGNPENNFQSLTELEDDYFGLIDATESGVIEFSIDGVDYMANVYHSEALGWKFVGLMEKDEIFASAREVGMTTAIVSLVLVVLFGVLGLYIANRIVTPINSVKDNLKTIAEGEGDLTTRIPVASRDEAGELAQWFNQFIESTQTMIQDIKSTAHDMDRVSADTSGKSADMSDNASQQLGSIEQIVTAVTEMAAAANEVAKNCVDTASVSENGMEATSSGKDVINRSAAGVEALGESIKSSNSVILELEKETGNINNILSTIQDIAEQTNLLALNAAIEAARAGEQGRGFAVVADEVRSLAQRTQSSTEEINKILSQLVNRTKDVSANMERSSRQSEEAVALTAEALQAFDRIEEAVEKIRDMTTQTASAAEEQHLVTEDINQNIVTINDSANHVTGVSREVAGLCARQAELNARLTQLVARFKTE